METRVERLMMDMNRMPMLVVPTHALEDITHRHQLQSTFVISAPMVLFPQRVKAVLVVYLLKLAAKMMDLLAALHVQIGLV